MEHIGDTSEGHFVRLLWDAVQGEWGQSGGGMVTWRMTGTDSHAFTFIMEGGETEQVYGQLVGQRQHVHSNMSTMRTEKRSLTVGNISSSSPNVSSVHKPERMMMKLYQNDSTIYIGLALWTKLQVFMEKQDEETC